METKHAVSKNGLCECGHLRPCYCGDHCPSCMSDIVEVDGKITCTGCKVELKRKGHHEND